MVRLGSVGGQLQFGEGLEAVAAGDVGEGRSGVRVGAERERDAPAGARLRGDRDRLDELRLVLGCDPTSIEVAPRALPCAGLAGFPFACRAWRASPAWREPPSPSPSPRPAIAIALLGSCVLGCSRGLSSRALVLSLPSIAVGGRARPDARRGSRRLGVEHPALERVADQLRPLAHSELALDVGAVRLDRPDAEQTAARRSRCWYGRARSAAGRRPRARRDHPDLRRDRRASCAPSSGCR